MNAQSNIRSIEVVAAVIERNGAFLATQRGHGALAGGWEFPGGKIEPGETPQQALVREIQEELRVTIHVGDLLTTVKCDYPDFHLTMHCYLCTLEHGHIELLEHSQARWLTGSELYSVQWLPADIQAVERLQQRLCPFTFRHGTLADVPTLLRLAEAAKRTMRASGNQLQWIDGYPSASAFEADIEHHVCIIMEREGNPVATFAFIPSPEPTYAVIEGGQWIDDTTPYYVIHRIASDGSQRRVLEAMLQYAWQHTSNLRIDTHRDNVIMRHLLAKNGFTYCGIIHLNNGDERLAYQQLRGNSVFLGSATFF